MLSGGVIGAIYCSSGGNSGDYQFPMKLFAGALGFTLGAIGGLVIGSSGFLILSSLKAFTKNGNITNKFK